MVIKNREGKYFCSVRNEVNTENREKRENKMLTWSELRIELDEI